MFPTLDTAIANFEGFGKPGSIATIQNNPGNLAYGPFAQSHGAIAAGAGGIAIFPDATTGAAAQDALVASYANKGYTLQDMITAWSPPGAAGNSPESTQNYIDYVASQTGLNPSDPVSAALESSQTGNPPSTPSGSSWSPLWGKLGSLPGILSDSAVSGISFSRVGAFLLGLILIAGGVFLLKPVQNVVITGAKTAAKTAL